MRNKAELMTFLQSKYLTVAEPEFVDEVENVKLYNVRVTEVTSDGEAGVRKIIQFYVYDEGGATEQAFLQSAQIDSFANKALDWIYAAGHAEVATLLQVDENRQKVIAKLYQQVDGTYASEKQAVVWRDGTDPVQIRILQ